MMSHKHHMLNTTNAMPYATAACTVMSVWDEYMGMRWRCCARSHIRTPCMMESPSVPFSDHMSSPYMYSHHQRLLSWQIIHSFCSLPSQSRDFNRYAAPRNHAHTNIYANILPHSETRVSLASNNAPEWWAESSSMECDTAKHIQTDISVYRLAHWIETICISYTSYSRTTAPVQQSCRIFGAGNSPACAYYEYPVQKLLHLISNEFFCAKFNVRFSYGSYSANIAYCTMYSMACTYI